METVKITRQLVTPAIAKRYLESNVSNRRISKPLLQRYVNEMKSGKWKEDTFELIKISKTGRILDGQHRLQAVVESNRPISFHVAHGIDESVFDVLDTGKSRNATDCFMVAGVKRNNLIPSIIAHYNLLEKGKKPGQQINNKSSNAELLRQYYKDEKLWQDVAKAAYCWYNAFAKVLPPSWIGGTYAYYYNLNPNKAIVFMNQLCTGLDISNNTISSLRNRLIKDKLSQRKMLPNLKMALITKAWNHFINDKQVNVLKYTASIEDFPIAIKG